LAIDRTVKYSEILKLTRFVAWGASDILRSFYRGERDIEANEDKKDGPVTAADLATNHYILETLQQELGTEEYGYLSEETYHTHEGVPVDKDLVWVIDPLDGTRDFIDKTGEYAIHIALTEKGRPILSVVAVPETDKIYYALKDHGTFVENRSGESKPMRVSPRSSIEELYLVASRTHRDERFQNLLNRMPFKDRYYVGSVGCKVSTILEGQSDVYISLSGKSAPKEWDFAAPELILTEAGGQFTHFNGDPLVYNKPDAKMWGGLMASNGHCHAELCQLANQILAELDS
jgi:3'(2'), 5'-bisphosphate nucleotidase